MEAYAEMYLKLDSREGQKMVYSLAKARHKGTQDINGINLIKDKDGSVIKEEEIVRRRWEEYFRKLAEFRQW